MLSTYDTNCNLNNNACIAIVFYCMLICIVYLLSIVFPLVMFVTVMYDLIVNDIICVGVHVTTFLQFLVLLMRLDYRIWLYVATLCVRCVFDGNERESEK